MSNRNIVKQQAIADSASTEVRLPKSLQRMEKARGRHKIKAAVEAASQYGADAAAEQVRALTWDQAVAEAQHEQLYAQASDLYHAASDRFFGLLTTWSHRMSTTHVFANSPATPAAYNWSHLIDTAGDPDYSSGELLGFESQDAANEWREDIGDIRSTAISHLWDYLSNKDASNGVHLSPLKEDGTYGDHTNVALLFKIGDEHLQVFAHLDDTQPGRWYINRIDIGDVTDSEGVVTWDEDYDAQLMRGYEAVADLHEKADKKQWRAALDTKLAAKEAAIIARRKKKGGRPRVKPPTA